MVSTRKRSAFATCTKEQTTALVVVMFMKFGESGDLIPLLLDTRLLLYTNKRQQR